MKKSSIEARRLLLRCNHQYGLWLVHHPQLESRNNFYPHPDLNSGPSIQNEKKLMLKPTLFPWTFIFVNWPTALALLAKGPKNLGHIFSQSGKSFFWPSSMASCQKIFTETESQSDRHQAHYLNGILFFRISIKSHTHYTCRG